MSVNCFAFKVSCCHRLSSGSGLGLGSLTAGLDALKDGLTVLVELELGDDHVGGVDAEGDGGTGGLLADDALDVDDVLEAVDGGDLALLVLLGATNDGDLVVLADGDRTDLLRLSITRSFLRSGSRRNIRCTSHGAPWRGERS